MNRLNANNATSFLMKGFEIVKHELGQNSLAIVATTTALACAIFALYCCASKGMEKHCSVQPNKDLIKIHLDKALNIKRLDDVDESWLQNDKIWSPSSDIKDGCIRRAKNFILTATQHATSPLPKFNYFVIAQKLVGNDALSYQTSRNIKWKYHVVLTYLRGNKRYIIEPSISKKAFAYNEWVNEITNAHPDKFRCLEINDFQGIARNASGEILGAFVNGSLVKIDQSITSLLKK